MAPEASIPKCTWSPHAVQLSPSGIRSAAVAEADLLTAMSYPKKLKVQAGLGIAIGLVLFVVGTLVATVVGGVVAIAGGLWMAAGVVTFADAGNWDEKVSHDVHGRFRRRVMRTGTVLSLGLLTWL